jgi:hypothetical protein
MGLLKLRSWGSGSGKARPQRAQVCPLVKVCRSPAAVRTSACPRPSLKACSRAPAMRVADSSPRRATLSAAPVLVGEEAVESAGDELAGDSLDAPPVLEAEGGGDGEAGSGGEGGEAVAGALDGVALDGEVAVGASGLADLGEEEPEGVVDLGGGADGGACVLDGVSLLEGDGGGDVVDEVDVGSLEALEELAGVG